MRHVNVRRLPVFTKISGGPNILARASATESDFELRNETLIQELSLNLNID